MWAWCLPLRSVPGGALGKGQSSTEGAFPKNILNTAKRASHRRVVTPTTQTPKPVVLAASKAKVAGLSAAGCVVLAMALSGDMREPNAMVPFFGMMILSLGCFAAAFTVAGCRVVLDSRGIRQCSRWSADVVVQWSDVTHVGLAPWSSSAGGKITYTYFAGLRLRDSVAHSQENSRARAHCGYDLVLTANCGLAPDRLVSVINDYRANLSAGAEPEGRAISSP